MKYFLTLFVVALSYFSFGQGLNAEMTYNYAYDQETISMLAVGNFTYIVTAESDQDPYGPSYHLSKIDTNGNLQWKTPLQTFVAYYHDLNLSEGDNGSILISGAGQKVCDVSSKSISYITKIDKNGTPAWTVKKDYGHNYNGPLSFSEGTLTTSNSVRFHFQNNKGSKIYTINSNGVLTDSVSIPKKNLTKITTTSNLHTIALVKDSILAFNNSGTIVVEKKLTKIASDIKMYNDTVYVLSRDSLFVFDKNLQLLQQIGFTSFSNFSNLKVSANAIQFVNVGSVFTCFNLNRNLGLLSKIEIPKDGSTQFDLNENHFVKSLDHSLTKFKSNRIIDYSLNNTTNSVIKKPDVGVINFEKTDIKISSYVQGSYTVYWIKIYGNALVKNYGTDTIKSVRINYFKHHGLICGADTYFKKFDGLAIPPGGTQLLDLGVVYDNTLTLSQEEFNEQICLYTSNPNEATDMTVGNDEGCTTINYPFAGLIETTSTGITLFPNPVNDKLQFVLPSKETYNYIIFNLQGKEILSGTIGSNTIDTRWLIDGYYSILLTSENGSESYNQRFVKVNE